MFPNFSFQQSSNSTAIPPTTQSELTGLVIDFLLSNSLILPIDSFSLLRNIKRGFRSVEYSTFVFKTLNINDSIRELITNGLVSCEEICINLKRAYYIKAINQEEITKYRLSLPDSKINTDYDKYYEKAKGIAMTMLTEKKNEIDKNNQDGLLEKVIIDEDALTDLNNITYIKKKAKTYKKK